MKQKEIFIFFLSICISGKLKQINPTFLGGTIPTSRKTKKAFFAGLNIKDVCDTRKFWKTLEPLFSEKLSSAV